MSAPDLYIATADIYISAGVRAHKKGDVVPSENVKANGWESFCSPQVTKAPAVPVAPGK